MRSHRPGTAGEVSPPSEPLTGRVLVVGGLNEAPDTFPENALAGAEIFEPGKGRFHKDHSHSLDFPDATPGMAVRIDPVGDSAGPSNGTDGTTAGNLPSRDGFAANCFLAPIAVALTASAEQPTPPTTRPATIPTPASAALPPEELPVDRLVAASAETDGPLALSQPGQRPLSDNDPWSALVLNDVALETWPFPAAPWE